MTTADNFKLQDTRNLVVKKKKKNSQEECSECVETWKEIHFVLLPSQSQFRVRRIVFKFSLSKYKYITLRISCISYFRGGIINRITRRERERGGGKFEAKGAHGRRMCTGIVGIFDATLRCPVVNESENKLVGRFHRKMQFTPFMEQAGSLVCACVCMHVRTYVRTHVCARARIETGDLGASTTADT